MKTTYVIQVNDYAVAVCEKSELKSVMGAVAKKLQQVHGGEILTTWNPERLMLSSEHFNIYVHAREVPVYESLPDPSATPLVSWEHEEDSRRIKGRIHGVHVADIFLPAPSVFRGRLTSGGGLHDSESLTDLKETLAKEAFSQHRKIMGAI